MNTRKITLLAACITSSSIFLPSTARSEIFGGINFPLGEVSFADRVFAYNPGPDVSGSFRNSQNVLGTPNGTQTSLGDNGHLIIEFRDNALVTSGTSAPDLAIFELGPVTEAVNLDISTNSTSWIHVGVFQGQPMLIDLDQVAAVSDNALYRFVRMIDIPPSTTGDPFGEADIDAVGAISTVIVNDPPVAVGFPANGEININAAEGEILDAMFSFIGPETGDPVTVTMGDPNNAIADGLVAVLANGDPATAALDWNPSTSLIGNSYDLPFDFVDSFSATGSQQLTINIIPEPISALFWGFASLCLIQRRRVA